MAAATAQSTSDEALVAAYQKSQNMLALAQLRQRCRDLVQSQVARYLAGPGHISRQALEAKADELLVDAARTYKPDAGAKFKTHLFNHLRRLDRYTKANANIVHVPESHANMITMFQTESARLKDQKRREPSDEELADHMSLPLATVQSLRRNIHQELPESQFGSTQGMAVGVWAAILDQQLADLYFDLSPDERLVLDCILGQHGHKKLDKGQNISKATGFSQAKVSQIRTRIAQALRPHLDSQRLVTT